MAVEDGPDTKRQKINPEDYVCSAAEAIKLKMVEHGTACSSEDLFGAVTSFPPEFCHQMFGEHEEIKGYAGLGVDVWMSLNNFHTWIDVRFAKKRYTAVDLNGILRACFPAGYATSKAEFEKQVAAETIDVFQLGRNLHSRQLPDGSELHLQLHQLATSGPSIQGLHKRFQPLLLFFVDGASAIEQDDPRWDLVLAVRRLNGKDSVVGFMTLYNFFAYPDQTRLRLSQILVLPPFQRLGIGRDMMRAAYNLAVEKDVVDLTLEDPSPALQKLRDKMDLGAIMGLPWLKDLAEKVAAEAAAGAAAGGEAADDNGGGAHAGGGSRAAKAKAPRSPLALSVEALLRIRKDLRLHKAQAKAVWEAMLMLQPAISTPQGDAALRQLVSSRLEALHLPSSAEAVPGRITRDEQEGTTMVFEMFRTRWVPPGRCVAGEGGEAGDDASVMVGRRGVVQVDPAARAAALAQLLEERMAELQPLVAWWRSTAA